MPPVSQAQRRWAFAKMNEPTKEGAAAKEFAEADKGGKLPERKNAKERREKLYPNSK